MRIFNGTEHTINVYAKADTTPIQGGRKLVLKPGAKPTHVIPAGKNLNASKANAKAPNISDCEIPLVGAVVFTGHDPVPHADLVICSNLYRAAVKEMGGNTSRLATVDGTVYEDEKAIRPCGCTGLSVG